MNEYKEAIFYLVMYIWPELKLKERIWEKEEKYVSLDEKEYLRIEEFEVKNKYGEEIWCSLRMI